MDKRFENVSELSAMPELAEIEPSISSAFETEARYNEVSARLTNFESRRDEAVERAKTLFSAEIQRETSAKNSVSMYLNGLSRTISEQAVEQGLSGESLVFVHALVTRHPSRHSQVAADGLFDRRKAKYIKDKFEAMKPITPVIMFDAFRGDPTYLDSDYGDIRMYSAGVLASHPTVEQKPYFDVLQPSIYLKYEDGKTDILDWIGVAAVGEEQVKYVIKRWLKDNEFCLSDEQDQSIRYMAHNLAMFARLNLTDMPELSELNQKISETLKDKMQTENGFRAFYKELPALHAIGPDQYQIVAEHVLNNLSYEAAQMLGSAQARIDNPDLDNLPRNIKTLAIETAINDVTNKRNEIRRQLRFELR